MHSTWSKVQMTSISVDVDYLTVASHRVLICMSQTVIHRYDGKELKTTEVSAGRVKYQAHWKRMGFS